MTQDHYKLSRRKFLKSATAVTARLAAGPLNVTAGAPLTALFKEEFSYRVIADSLHAVDKSLDAFGEGFSWYSNFPKFAGPELSKVVTTSLETLLPPIFENLKKMHEVRAHLLSGDPAKAPEVIKAVQSIIRVKKEHIMKELEALASVYSDNEPQFNWPTGAIDRQNIDEFFKNLKLEVEHYYKGSTRKRILDEDLMDLRSMSYAELLATHEHMRRDALKLDLITAQYEDECITRFQSSWDAVKLIADEAGINCDSVHALTDYFPSNLLDLDATDDQDREITDILFDDHLLFERLEQIVSLQTRSVATCFYNGEDALRTTDNIHYATNMLGGEVRRIYRESLEQFFPHLDVASLPLPSPDADIMGRLKDLGPLMEDVLTGTTPELSLPNVPFTNLATHLTKPLMQALIPADSEMHELFCETDKQALLTKGEPERPSPITGNEDSVASSQVSVPKPLEP